MDKEKVREVSKVVREFQEDCNPNYQKVSDVYWEKATNGIEGIIPEIHVVIEESETYPSESTYCYPVANFGRERGLFLYDTVSDWEKETVTLRFRFQD